MRYNLNFLHSLQLKVNFKSRGDLKIFSGMSVGLYLLG